METGESRNGDLRQFAAVIAVIVTSFVAAQFAVVTLDAGLGVLAVTLVEASVIAVMAGLVLWFAILRQLRAQGRAQRFNASLHSALQMSSTEKSTHHVVERAITTIGVPGRSRLLLADSSQTHLKPTVDTAASQDAPCTVAAPFDCPAIRRAQTSSFPDVRELDVCPWLASGPQGTGHGAACIPLSVVGGAIGVLQVSGRTEDLPDGPQLQALEVVAEQAGTRLGMLRVMEQTHLQAATDLLTGLLNRRSLENRAHELFRSHAPFALAMADLDHFKVLNDTHGHDAGDRALRVFARTVRSVLRSEDVIARYGGEEFVIIFPGQSVDTAASALERVREALALAVTAGTIPGFTASFGVASSTDADTLDDLLRLADASLFAAKRQGRNRVVIDRANT